MRFSEKGAHSLAKVIELNHNGLLRERILKKGDERREKERKEAIIKAASAMRKMLKRDPERWLQALYARPLRPALR